METKTTIVREVVAEYRGPAFRQRAAIRDAETAANFVRKVLPDNSREHFVSLYLDAARTVVGFSIETGIANACVAHPREIFQPAILLGSTDVLIAHSHPSGSCIPSRADKELTKVVQDAGRILGIAVLDHVIVGDAKSFYSFREHDQF